MQAKLAMSFGERNERMLSWMSSAKSVRVNESMSIIDRPKMDFLGKPNFFFFFFFKISKL